VCLQLLVGFVVGALYAHFTFHDLQQMTFMVALAVGFTLSLASSRVLGPGMVVYWREAAPGVGMGLSPSAYLVAKCVVELPRIGLLSLALLATFYPQAGHSFRLHPRPGALLGVRATRAPLRSDRPPPPALRRARAPPSRPSGRRPRRRPSRRRAGRTS
jgi:hypothetical protein